MRAPMLVSAPHGGRTVPPDLDDIWALSAADAFHDGDPLTARIYDFTERVERGTHEHLPLKYRHDGG